VHAAPLPCRGHRPADGADPHVSRPSLSERRTRDRHELGDDSRGPLCVRRDRRGYPRSEPDDGQLPPRVLRVRPPRRPGRSGEGKGMSVVETDLQGTVEDAAAHLYVWALKDIPQDLRDALAAAAARETPPT